MNGGYTARQCVRDNYLHRHLAKRPGLVLWEHVWQVQRMIARYLEDVPNSCLRFEENEVVFLLLTLKGDLKWRYGVNELHPRAREFRLWERMLLVQLTTHGDDFD